MGPALDDEVLETLFRSARSFKTFHDDPIAHDQLRLIWDLMKLGPTALNQQPARLVWCHTEAARARLAACAAGANAARILSAPATVIVAEDLTFPETLPEFFPNGAARHIERYAADPVLVQRSALMNTSLQAGYLILAARAVGLDAGPMGGFDRDRVNAEFLSDWPQRSAILLVSLGRGDREALPERPLRAAFERFNSVL